MATAESVKAKLRGLIDKANDITGGADADLTNAVDRLCDGYGSGGGIEVVAQAKTVTPTKAKQTVLPDTGYTHLSKVTVNAIPSQYIVPSGSLEITANGTYDVTGIARVVIRVSGGGATRYIHSVEINCLATEDYSTYETVTLVVITNDETPFDTWTDFSALNGLTINFGGTEYTIQSFDGTNFTMTDGTILIIDSPGEIYDTVVEYEEGTTIFFFHDNTYRVPAGTIWRDVPNYYDFCIEDSEGMLCSGHGETIYGANPDDLVINGWTYTSSCS